MSSLILKEIIKALKKQFGKDKEKNPEGEKKAEEPSKPAVPDAPTVPPGWTAHLDVAANRYYYVETATGKTQWDPPEGTIMPPPKEVKKEEKKPDYMKMAKDYHKKSSKSAFLKAHLSITKVFRFFPFIDIFFHPYLLNHRLISRSYTSSVTKLTHGHFRPAQ
ncbi:hypothetical protein MMC29_002002 [Sticta canariensis]|nr:hypothetical protein [Sticta canariensis]